jgi:hypothetical protein
MLINVRHAVRWFKPKPSQGVRARASMLREKLIGAWNLVSIVHCPVDGSESVHIMGEKPAGIILYTPDGYVSAQLMREDYAGGSSHDPESSGLTYIAYSGPFRVDVDTQTIMHSMFVSLNPNWQGQTQPRIADLDGTILRLSGPAEIDGRMGEAVVTWERTDERLERFTELLATPIANADSMSELAASRRRIITAADDARRRIERDLHDGTQQRLVSLGLALRIAQSAEPSNCSALQAEIGRAADELDEILLRARHRRTSRRPAAPLDPRRRHRRRRSRRRFGPDRAARPGAGPERVDRGQQPARGRDGDPRRTSAAPRLIARPPRTHGAARRPTCGWSTRCGDPPCC